MATAKANKKKTTRSSDQLRVSALSKRPTRGTAKTKAKAVARKLSERANARSGVKSAAKVPSAQQKVAASKDRLAKLHGVVEKSERTKRSAAHRSKPVSLAPSQHSETVVERSARRHLGQCIAPSGKLAVLDLNVLDALSYETLAGGILSIELPTPRIEIFAIDFTVSARRGDEHPAQASWRELEAIMKPSVVVAARKPAGHAAIDVGGLTLIDASLLPGWSNDPSDSALADVVISGKDARAVAVSTRAKPFGGEFGWKNLRATEAEQRMQRLLDKKRATEWNVQVELRPHTMLYQVAEPARQSEYGFATSRFNTSQAWHFLTAPLGVFPVFTLHDASGATIGLVIEFARK